MRRVTYSALLLLLVVTPRPASSDDRDLALHRAIPADTYLAVYGKHNPERDYQRPYFERIAETIRETRLIERTLETVMSQLPQADREQAQEVIEQLRAAAEPIDPYTLLTSQEVVYAQRMEPFQIRKQHDKSGTLATSQHLVILRLTPEDAENYERGLKNLFQLIQQYSQGKITIDVETTAHESMTVTCLTMPRRAPYRPAVARVDDVILFSSSSKFLQCSLAMLLGGDGVSKFEDPRFAEALQQLPEPEDALIVYDGRTQFEQMTAMLDGIQEQASGNPNAARWLELVKSIFEEVGIVDFVVTVEYTEDNRNCEESLGKLLPDVEGRLLTEMLGSGEQFEDWQQWVPADATAYSLTTGADLHAAYKHVTSMIRERIPEMQLPLENFEKWQRQIDLHLDVDLLQAFSGESVSITLPRTRMSPFGSTESVSALRCHKPARIRWLIERLFERLNQYPAFQLQRLALVDCEELDGFEEVSAMIFKQLGVRPVIGFQHGWMIIGSSPTAVQRVLDTLAGEATNIAETDGFQKLQLEIDGPVQGVRYMHLGEQIRQISTACQQAGVVMPMVIGLAKANLGEAADSADLEKLIPLQVVAELLSGVGKIVGEFDFLQEKFTVTQDGPQPGTWHGRTVTLIRPAE